MKFGHISERILRRHGLKLPSKATTVTCFCFMMFLFFVMINNRYLQNLRWYDLPAPCETPKFIMDEMIELTVAVSSLLTSLNISHCLCYGTLWGALRYGRTLPWDNNVDFCVLKKEIENIPRAKLYKHFRAKNMKVVYDHLHGEYIIERGPAKACLTVFLETSSGEAVKDGFIFRFLWFLQAEPVRFPSHLLKAPLNGITFHGRTMPVPHNDMEILKHLYKNDWWLEKSPPGCTAVHTAGNKLATSSGS